MALAFVCGISQSCFCFWFIAKAEGCIRGAAPSVQRRSEYASILDAQRTCCGAQVNAVEAEDASAVSLSGAGLTARAKPSVVPVLEAQDREPMYPRAAAHSDCAAHVQ